MAEQLKAALSTKAGETPAPKPKAAPKPVPGEEVLDEREIDEAAEAAAEARRRQLAMWPLEALERR